MASGAFRALLGAWLGQVGLGLMRFVYPYLVPFLEWDFSMGHGGMGLLVTAFFMTDMAMRAFWGRFADRHGPKRALLAGLALLGLGFGLCGLARKVWSLALSFGVIGAGVAVSFVVPAVLLSPWFGPRGRGLAISLSLTGANVVMVIAGLVLPWATTRHGYRIVWWADALIVGLLWVVVLFAVRDPEGRAKTRGKGAVGEVVRTKGFVPMLSSYFFFGISYSSFMTFVVSYLVERGWPYGEASHLLAFQGLFWLFCGIPWGWLGDRYPRHRVYAGALLLGPMGIVGVLAASEALAYPGAFLWALSGIGTVVGIQALQRDYFPPERVGTAIGLNGSAFSAAAALGPAVAGSLADACGTLLAALLFSVGSAALSALVALRLPPPSRGGIVVDVP